MVVKIKIKSPTIISSRIHYLYFAGFRWETGTDWNNYIFYFRTVDQLKSDVPVLVYELLARTIKFIFGNYQFMLLITAALIITFTYKTISEFSPYPLFSVFLLYTYSLNSGGFGYRQDIAIALCFSLYFLFINETLNNSYCVF